MPQPSVRSVAVPGGWTEQTLAVGSRSFQIVLPAEPDRFLEQLEHLDKLDAADNPYWATLWPAAQQTAEFILRHEWPHGRPALELGCGVGLVGLAGLAAGLDVTFSDVNELAVSTAIENAKRNGFDAAGRRLDWGQPDASRYPLLLAADVLYDPKLHAPLLDTILNTLDRRGECWIGDPGRSAASQFIAAVPAASLQAKMFDEHGSAITSPQIGEFFLLRLSRR